MKRSASLLMLLAMASTGCLSVTSKVPGVLDLRSDGADAPANTTALPQSATRSGFEGFAWGEGVKGNADVTIEDRNHYVLSFLPIGNESSTEEWKTALGGEAMRNVAITEQYQFITWAVSFVKGIIPLGGLVQGTMDFRARGTRISTGASVRDESIPPPPSSTGTTTTDPSVGY